MSLINTVVAIISGSIFLSLLAFGQDSPTSKAEIGIEAPVPLVENTNARGAQQSATVDYGFFYKSNGAELNNGYTRKTQTCSSDSGSPGVKNTSGEAPVAYVLRFPAKRWPALVPAGDGTQTRLQYLYGGADFNPKPQIPRPEHQGIFFNSTTFNRNGLDQFTNGAEPSVVFGYSFKR